MTLYKCFQDGVAGFTCSCVTGWEGDTCNVNINDCRPDSCQNGGTCQVRKSVCMSIILRTVIIFVTYRMESIPSAVYVQRVMRETAVRPTPMTVIPSLVKMEAFVR